MQLHATNFGPGTMIVVYALEIAVQATPPTSTSTTLVILPLPVGCTNYLPTPTVHLLAFPVAGSTDISIAIPNNPSLDTTVLPAQTFSVALLSLSVLEASNTVCLNIGS